MSQLELGHPDLRIGSAPDALGLPLGVEAVGSGKTQVLRLRGELDMATAPRLRRALDATLDAGPSSLALDLDELTFIDSRGIRVLLDTARRARTDGCSFVLRSPRRSVLKAIGLTGADLLLPVEPAASSA